MEQVLRTHRDHALQLLKENKAQSREGIEMLVKGRLAAIAAAAHPQGTISPEHLESLYREVVDLSYMIFALGFTVAQTGEEARR
ncbi:MAG TPA: hypothetical protein VNT26_24900 [Candidatus Sulfotelmatobacter sp.]|nr:hypothetical protein [Candidatus Sulfotelmatobacter sp.]HWI65198.1 hypothetical protein [Symbiobacteriaceae bacterium]